MDENKTRKLYDNLSSDGYELGTYDDFKANLADDGKRRKFHEHISQDGYELGDYDSFSGMVSGEAPKIEQDEPVLEGNQQFNDEPVAENKPDDSWRTSMLSNVNSIIKGAKDTTARFNAPKAPSAPTGEASEAPQQEYITGFGPAFKQGVKQLGYGLKAFAGEVSNVVTGSSLDDENALVALDKDREMWDRYASIKFGSGLSDKDRRTALKGMRNEMFESDMAEYDRVFEQTHSSEKARNAMEAMNAINRHIAKVLKDTGGDVDKARQIIEKEADTKTWGDRQMQAAMEKAESALPTKGFGAWVGNLAPQMIPSAAAMAVGAITKNPNAARIMRPVMGVANMGTLSASTAGSSMIEARKAGANSNQVWAVGMADGMTEMLTEWIPFDKYTKKIFRNSSMAMANSIEKALNTNAGREELEKAVKEANRKLGGKLLNGRNIAEYMTDVAAEAASEFAAEAIETITPIIYLNPEEYPTFGDVIRNGWEGAKGGLFMGAVLGGASMGLQNAQNRARRKAQGYVNVAVADFSNDEDSDGSMREPVEVLSYNRELGTYTVLRGNEAVEVNKDKVGDMMSFTFDEFDNARILNEEAIREQKKQKAFDDQYMKFNLHQFWIDREDGGKSVSIYTDADGSKKFVLRSNPKTGEATALDENGKPTFIPAENFNPDNLQTMDIEDYLDSVVQEQEDIEEGTRRDEEYSANVDNLIQQFSPLVDSGEQTVIVNGAEVKGIIAEVTPDGITMELSDGSMPTFSWDSVAPEVVPPSRQDYIDASEQVVTGSAPVDLFTQGAEEPAVEQPAEAPVAEVPVAEAEEPQEPAHEIPRQEGGDIDYETLAAQNPQEFYVQVANEFGLDAARSEATKRYNAAEKAYENAKLNEKSAAKRELDKWKSVMQSMTTAENEAKATMEKPVEAPAPAAPATPEPVSATDARDAERRAAQEQADADFHFVTEKYDASPKMEGNVSSRRIGDRKIKGRYVLVEANAPTASHDPNNGFQPSKGFPMVDGLSANSRDYTDTQTRQSTENDAQRFNEKALHDTPVVTRDGVVISGNGRTIMSQIAAKNGTDTEYLDALNEEAANYGFTTEQIAQFKNPRVYFEVSPDEAIEYTASTFHAFNATEQKTESKSEAATRDGRILNEEKNARYLGNIVALVNEKGSLADALRSPGTATDIVKNMIQAGIATDKDVPRLIAAKDNTGTKELGERIENALLGTAFDGEILKILVDYDYPRSGLIKEAVSRALPAITVASQLDGEFNLKANINDAIALLYDATRFAEESNFDLKTADIVGEFIKNSDNLFESASYAPETELLARFIWDNHNKKGKNILEALTAYNTVVANATANNDMESMFGDEEKVEKPAIDLLKNAIFGIVNKDYESTGKSAAEVAPANSKDEPAPAQSPERGTEPVQGNNGEEGAVEAAPAAGENPPAEAPESKDTKAPEKSAAKELDDEIAALERELADKLGQLNSGIDPEALTITTKLTFLYVKKGLLKLEEVAKKLIEAIGDKVRPYITTAYYGARNQYKADGDMETVGKMSTLDEIDAFDAINFGKKAEAPIDLIATAEAKNNEAEVKKEAKSEESRRAEFIDTLDLQPGDIYRNKAGVEIEILGSNAGKIFAEARGGGRVFKADYTKDQLYAALFGRTDKFKKVEASEPAEAVAEKELSEADVKKLESKFVDVVSKTLVDAVVTEGEKPFKSINDIRQTARALGMKVDKDGRDDIRLQELVELGIINASRELVLSAKKNGRDNKIIFNRIVRLYDIQPTISRRSSDKIALQQYSTPIPMSFVADMFVGDNAKSILEPTAGNGMLTIGLEPSRITVNEIDSDRLANLKKQGFGKVLEQDGTKLFPGGKVFDAVVANPPFGKAEAKEYDGKLINGLENQIALNALSSMVDNGRAAIIVGGNMEYAANGSIKNNKPFYTYIYNHYNVKGVVDMDGGLYAKQGTTYPTRMILIDGRRSDEEIAQSTIYPPVKEQAIAKVKTFDELYNTVNELINSTQKTNGNEILRTEPGLFNTVGNSEPDLFNSGNERGADDAGGQDGGRPDNKGGRRDGNEKPSATGEESAAETGEGGTENRRDERVSKQGTGESRADGDAGVRVQQGDNGLPAVEGVRGERAADTVLELNEQAKSLEKPKQEIQERNLSTDKLPYIRHNTAFSLDSIAPAAMVEAMDKTLTEIENEYGNVEVFVAKELGYGTIDELHNALAAEQIDGVAMAIAQMKKGQALIIGDQTGIGKGRQMASLIRWAVRQGTKPVFVTKTADLFTDLYRDLVDIGSGDLKPFIFNSDGAMLDQSGEKAVVVYKPATDSELKAAYASGKIPDKYDFAITTYSQCNTGDSQSREEAKVKKTPKRPDSKAALVRALSKDSYLLLDESHTAAGDSNQGAFFRSILKDVKASTFASATFAKRPDTMPLYAIRTAMSKANVSQEDLINIITKGGVTLQEIMSRALTDAGQMVRRERDMKGVITEWKTIDDEATVKRARDNYDKTIEVFNDIIDFQKKYIIPKVAELDAEIAMMAESAGIKKGTKGMGVDNPPFVNKTYNYTKQLMLAIKSDAIVDEVVKQIGEGRHPVIALESTMESAIKDNYDVGDKIDEPTFSMSLLKGLNSVMQYTVKDADGKESHGSYLPEELGEAGKKAYYDLQDKIREATGDIFISPIDAIINGLEKRGYKVGELTGRSTYIIQNADGTAEVKRRTDKDKKKMQRDFNSGALDVLILNKTASTGISLQANAKFKDRRQRAMIIAQPLSDINDYMQMIGRIDRTGQVARGYYINLGLPVPAETRFLMMLSTKLKSLNANTTTSQENEDNSVDAPDLLNKYGSQVVLEYLRDNTDIYEKMGEPLKGESGNVKVSGLDDYKPKEEDARFITGRVALLSTKEQDAFYDDVTERYVALIKYLDDTNSNDLKISVMPLRAKTISKKVSSPGNDPNGANPFAKDAFVEEIEMDILRKPLKADDVKKLISSLTDGKGEVDIPYFRSAIAKDEEEKLAKAQASYDKAQERIKEQIAKFNEKVDKSTKMPASEKEEKKRDYAEKLNKESYEKFTNQTVSISTNAKRFLDRIKSFAVGNTYLVPDTFVPGMLSQFSTPSVFCGFKTGKKLTMSTTLAVFATLDGRQRVEVKLSNAYAIEVIQDQTSLNYDAARYYTLNNWDEQIPKDARTKGYMLTGNILQAIKDAADDFGNYPGQLVTYSDIDGGIHDGVLMPNGWKPNQLRSSGVPIMARLADIQEGKAVESSDGKVRLERYYRTSDTYLLNVPKSKKAGAKFFEDKVLLSLIDFGRFYQRGDSFMADVNQRNIVDVVNRLTELGVRVNDEERNNDGDKKYSLITDEALLARLNSEPTVKAYRAMQVIDGKLYPPMAARVNGEMVEGRMPGEWEQADEHPELIKYKVKGKNKYVSPEDCEIGKDGILRYDGEEISMTNGQPNGYFVLDKGGKDATGKKATLVTAAYNPYWHTSMSPLNDQFKSAWIRPNVVTVEVEIPESELTSGYRAKGAKEPVGSTPWHSGPVSDQLAEAGKPAREVILSRYDKVARIVPETEVAKKIADMLKGTDVVIPMNTVTPKLRQALEAEGVKIGAPEKGVELNEQVAEALSRGLEVDNRLMDIADIEDAATRTGEMLGTKIVFHNSAGLRGRDKKAYGWFEPKDGSVHIVSDNIPNVDVAIAKVFHETVAHKGLRELMGDDFNTFLDNIYDNVDKEIKAKINKIQRSGRVDNRRDATEEYLADLAERGPMDIKEFTLWQKLRTWATELLRRLGVKLKLNDQDLRGILTESYIRMRRKGTPLQTANDIALSEAYKDAAVESHDDTTDGGNTPGGGGNGGSTRRSGHYSGKDAEYMKAVEEGNMKKAQRMVEDAFLASFPNSKALDGNGRPLVVYHGSPSTFNEFNREALGMNTEVDSARSGFFFTPDKKLADWFRDTAEVHGEGYDVFQKSLLDYVRRNISQEMAEFYVETHGSDFNYEDMGWKSRAKELAVSTLEGRLDGWFSNMDELAADLRDMGLAPSKTYSVFLNIENPVIDSEYRDYVNNSVDTRMTDVIRKAFADGNDGVIFTDINERGGRGPQFVVFEPSAIKSAEPVTYDDNGNVIPLSERFNADKSDMRFSRAYHGTGANFVKFEKGHEKEGTGSMVFGHGTYVSFDDSVAKSYAEGGALRSSDYRYNGEVEPWQEHVVDEIGKMVTKSTDIKKAIARYKKTAKGDLEWARQEGTKDMKEQAELTYKFVSGLKESDFVNNTAKRNLYEIEIPFDNGNNYLMNDKVYGTDELSVVLSRVEEELKSSGFILDAKHKNGTSWNDFKNEAMNEGRTGRYIYDGIQSVLRNVVEVDNDNAQQMTSELLGSAGFVGLKYGNNAVIFNPDDIEIAEHRRYSLIPEEEAGEDFDTMAENLAALAEVDKKVNDWKTRVKEIMFDETAPIRAEQEVIADYTGKPIGQGEDVSLAMKQASSKFATEKSKFDSYYLNPLFRLVGRIAKKSGLSTNEMTEYLALKNGLERQVVFAKRDAIDELQGKREAALRNEKERYNKEVDALKSRIQPTANGQSTEMDEAGKRKLAELDAKHEGENKRINEHYDTEIERVNRGDAEQTEYKKYRQKEYGAIRIWFAKYKDANGNITDKIPERPDGWTDAQYNELLNNPLRRVLMDDNMPDAEARAQRRITELEKKINSVAVGGSGTATVDKLWSTIRKCTDATIRLQYEHQLISRGQMEALIGDADGNGRMFQYYVPLRGFDQDTAEDIYNYYEEHSDSNFVPPIIRAGGRVSKADNPLTYLGPMHYSAAAQAFRNDIGNALYKFVRNHKDQPMLTVNKTWYVKGEFNSRTGKQRWIPRYPDIPAGTTLEEQEAIVKAFEEQMRSLKESGEAFEGTRGLNSYNSYVFIDKADADQHVIHMKHLGKEYSIIANGTPRMAQAINGQLRDTSSWGLWDKFMRLLSKTNTSLRPGFWITNLQRDLIYGASNIWINHGFKYSAAYKANLAHALRVIPMYMHNGELRQSGSNSSKKNYYIRMFNDYMKFGGPTGQTVINNHEWWVKHVEQQVKAGEGNVGANAVNALREIGDTFLNISESIEQISRFAAFVTARESGMPMDEAINEAKQVTLNFNQKGSMRPLTWEETADVYMDGRKLGSKYDTDNDLGDVAKNTANWIRRRLLVAASQFPKLRHVILFYNAIMQSVYKTYQNFSGHPYRSTAMALTMAGVGALTAALLGGDDDDDAYATTSDYRRHNKFMVRLGKSQKLFLLWGVPQEFVPFYGFGENVVRTVQDRQGWGHTFTDLAKETMDQLVVNPLNIEAPALLQPVWENLTNTNYQGSPVSRRNYWNQDEPGFLMANNNTWRWLIYLDERLNAMTGGDEYSRGWLDEPHFGDNYYPNLDPLNPAYQQNIIESLGGGAVKDLLTTVNIFSKLADPDKSLELRDFPITSRVLYNADDMWTKQTIGEQFKHYSKIVERMDKKYKKADKDGNEAKLNEYAMEPAYDMWQAYSNNWKESLEDNWETFKYATSDANKKRLLRERDEIRQEFINRCIEIEEDAYGNGKD